MKLPAPAKLRLRYYPEPVLKRKCPPVTEFGPALQAVAERMLALMREAKGIGLAAPQVGIPLRFFVCNPTGEGGDDLICINPRFLELGGGAEASEGCLRRAQRALMQAFDAAGRSFEVSGEDLKARVWQHETDHLDGRLIIDNMSDADEIANRRAIKQLREQHQGRKKA
ncbi:MAG: peptide deformylase [Planctomycetes bacterium]|nr:peptide deformylase [Planctomycetota bacterium]